MSVARLRLAPVGETMFPPRTPFFHRPICQGNREVPTKNGGAAAQREGGSWVKQAYPRSGSNDTAPTGVADGGPHATAPKAREAAA